YWDNAYCIHGLYENNDKLKNIFDSARKAGNFDRVLTFASTSKITFAGAGVACMGASEENLTEFLKHLSVRQICPNKVNQVMHVAYLKNVDNIKKIMAKHADILRPKFELVNAKLAAEFVGDDFVKWTKPRGGYFISLDVRHCAKRIVALAKSVGVVFTPAGSAFPYHIDDNDSNIRIAPSVPSLEELDTAIDVLIVCIKIARLELVISKKQ
ncbi:MAG: aminotransferase, partial [Clostridia bacterium]|nr:aminotransferase [Clostridia bacterium]